jgi:hypothetical protein
MDDEAELPQIIHIAVGSQCAEDALVRFREAGFEPVSATHGKGSVTYSFATPADEKLSALLFAIPDSYHWKRGFIVGDDPSGAMH